MEQISEGRVVEHRLNQNLDRYSTKDSSKWRNNGDGKCSGEGLNKMSVREEGTQEP